MTLSELRAHTRVALLRDERIPYLWTDGELDRYLNEAYRLFAVRTHCFVSSEEDFCTIDTEPGTWDYPIDPRIVQVNEAYIETCDDASSPPTYHQLRDLTRRQQPYRGLSGRPMSYVMQVGTNRLRLSPVPDDVYTVKLVCTHKPVRQLTSDGVTNAIPEEYELALCDYAAMRALRCNDPEKANMASAKEFEAQWNLTVRDAKRDLAVLRAGSDAQARGNWTGKPLQRTY